MPRQKRRERDYFNKNFEQKMKVKNQENQQRLEDKYREFQDNSWLFPTNIDIGKPPQLPQSEDIQLNGEEQDAQASQDGKFEDEIDGGYVGGGLDQPGGNPSQVTFQDMLAQ